MLCLIILSKNEILDIFYNGLTDASRDHLDSCAGCVFRERTPDEAEVLLNNMLTNENNWTLPEPTPKPTPKKRGILFLSPEDMQEAKKSMKEKGIKAEDVKNLPPVEEIHGLNSSPIEETHGLDNPTQGLLLIAPKAMSLFMLMVMSIRYTFGGNNLKSTISILLEKFQQLLLEVLNFLFLLLRRNMIFLLLGMCISPLR